MIIFIVGPGGAGKTTTGEILAQKNNFNFIDLDQEFIKNFGDVGKYISDFSYEKYCYENSNLCLSIINNIQPKTIFALSSGFLTYRYSGITINDHLTLLKNNGKLIMLMPSDNLEECVKIIVNRQLQRPWELDRQKETKKITSRFNIYKNIGDIKIFSQKSPLDIAREMENNIFLKNTL